MLLLLVACSRPLDGTLTERRLYAESLDTTYTYGTYIPAGATLGPATPWLLLLDGDGLLETVAAMLDREVRAGRAAPIVLVGLGHAATRERDYTPLPTLQPAPSGDWSDWTDSVGGIDPFFAWVTSTVVPDTEAELDIGGDPSVRGITGHSYGGLATLDAMMFHRDVFGRFGASSPSLLWDEGVPFTWEEDQFATSTSMDTTLFVSMGSAEAYPMDAMFDGYVDVLESRNYQGFKMTSKRFEGDDHLSVVNRSFPAILSTLFPADEPR